MISIAKKCSVSLIMLDVPNIIFTHHMDMDFTKYLKAAHVQRRDQLIVPRKIYLNNFFTPIRVTQHNLVARNDFLYIKVEK